MKKLSLLAAAIAVFSLSSLSSCTDDNAENGGSASVNVRLTDAPALYDRVNIDVQKIEFNTNNGWKSMNVGTPGVYNLLDFKNGMDVLLAQAELPAGNLSQMRLVLGSNNSIVKDGVTYPLDTPSAMQSGLKFNWNQVLEEDGAYTVWIDFDAARSIVKRGNGTYALKPVVRAFSELTDGQIKGYVLPQAAKAQVHVISGANDTIATALPNVADGFFMFKGLPANTYTVSYDADATTTYKDQNQTGVSVVYGKVSDLGSKTLAQ